MPRSWEGWDGDGVAAAIEAYWANSDYEQLHRNSLERLCAGYLRPDDAVLEVGCGTGRIYERLVPGRVANERYTGVDTSERMLEIARARHPQGRFLRGDAFDLGLGERAFDVALCFEVLLHLPSIDAVIRELLNAVRRVAIFTVWPASDQVVEFTERLRGSTFLYRRYPHAYVCEQIRAALPGVGLELEVGVLSDECWAYALQRRDAWSDLHFTRLFPVTGMTQGLRERLQAQPAGAHG